MIKVNHNNAVKLILAVVLSGCASGPVEKAAETPVLPADKPATQLTIQPKQPYPSNYAVEPNFQHYFATQLTGT